MILWSFMMNFWLWPLVTMTFYLHTTERSEHEQHLQHDCLQYSTRRDSKLTIAVDYCLRPSNSQDHLLLKSEAAPYHPKFTFDQLFHLNITAEHLFSWSTSADLVEDYQYYVNTKNETLALKEVFRCIQPWFGARCQYMFMPEKKGGFAY